MLSQAVEGLLQLFSSLGMRCGEGSSEQENRRTHDDLFNS
jgi:hypothetical protein